MPRSYLTLDLADARRMLAAAERAAEAVGIAYCIAVTDAGGDLLTFVRQDGALPGCIDLAIGKARTARLFERPTEELNRLAQPGAELFGIQQSNGGVVLIGGGLPILENGAVVGAIGASAGTVAQDVAVCEAGRQALTSHTAPSRRS
jgi:uncharacterized protein GlcG (DUF336 family)